MASSARCAQAVALHADEPLLGGAENHRVMAAPAVRIGVRRSSPSPSSAPRSFRISMTSGIAFPDRLADELLWKRPAAPSGWKKRPRGVDRAIDGMPYCMPDDVVFLAVAGRRVNRAGALFERDVIGQDADGIALQKGMAENRAFQLCAREARDDIGLAPTAFLGRDAQKVGGARCRPRRPPPPPRIRTSGETRWPGWPEWSRAWWSRSVRKPCCPPVPDAIVAASEVSVKRTQIDGLMWFSYSTSASASAVRSWMHQFTGLRPL